jgi:hypothetical protein
MVVVAPTGTVPTVRVRSPVVAVAVVEPLVAVDVILKV